MWCEGGGAGPPPMAQGPAHTASHTPFPIPGQGIDWFNLLFGPPDPSHLIFHAVGGPPCASWLCEVEEATMEEVDKVAGPLIDGASKEGGVEAAEGIGLTLGKVVGAAAGSAIELV